MNSTKKSRYSKIALLFCILSSLLLGIQEVGATNKNKDFIVRIGILENADKVKVSATSSYKIIHGAKELIGTKASSVSNLSLNGSKLKLDNTDKECKSSEIFIDRLSNPNCNDLNLSLKKKYTRNSFILLPDDRDALVQVGDKYYRGFIEIIANENITVINHVDLEGYLKGVIPSEMPSSWDLEALKAQAVCARTYTLANLNKRKALGYDLKATVEDQVYHGYSEENSRTNLAVELTAGEVLVDKNGQIVEAYYSSKPAVYTSDIGEIWGLANRGFLVPKQEPWGSSLSWNKQFSFNELDAKLRDLKIGSIQAITPLYSVNNKTKPYSKNLSVLLTGSDGSAYLNAEELRHKLALRSTTFKIKPQQEGVSFSGEGFGHGIGMSQHGANSLAKRGSSYKNILEYYYHGSNLENI